jgi:hypothetical protein
MRTRLVLVLPFVLLLLLGPAAAASGQTATGTVTFVHGIPTETVDIYVRSAGGGPDFDLLGVPPGSVTDPDIQLVNAFPAGQLPAGTYDVEVYAAGDSPDADAPIVAGSFEVETGAFISVVVHWDADGNPTLSTFTNDVSQLDAGEARLTVRHTAAAGAVDVFAGGELETVSADDGPERVVLVGGDPIFTGLQNGDEGAVDLAAGTIAASVVRAGTDQVVIGGKRVDLAEGADTILYAIGKEPSPDVEQRVELLVQIIDGLHQPPSGVDSGTGGLKHAEDTAATRLRWAVALAGLAAVGAISGFRRTSRAIT